MYDLLIKNGRLCDGSGVPAFTGDIAIKDGKIAELGEIDGEAKRLIDATDLVVAPGFFEPHTHYDAQITWDGLATPVVEHGITSIVQGNCSLSLAPVKKEHRQQSGMTFRHIEEMPENAFDAGLKWNWETFGEYVESFRDSLGLNVGTLVGHSAIRTWVLGDEAMQRSSTDEEIVKLQQVLRDCMEQGGLGLSTSCADIDHTYNAVACRHATPAEISALCEVLSEFGATLQILPEFWDEDMLCARIDQMADISRKHNINVTLSPLFHSNATPTLVDTALNRAKEQAAHGAKIFLQVQTRAIDVTFTMNEPASLFATMPTWWQTLAMPKEEKIGMFKSAEHRAVLIEELKTDQMPISLDVSFAQVIVSYIDSADNKNLTGMTLADIATQRGCDIADVMLDLALEEDFDVRFCAKDIGHCDSAKVAEMLQHPQVVVGAGDAGAHVSRFATYGDTGLLFSRYVRELQALSLEQAVKKLTSEPCELWGIKGRGYLRPGYAADLVIFDDKTIDRGPEVTVEDLPAPGWRFVRRANGIDKVIVNGALTYCGESGYTEDRAGTIMAQT